MQNEEKIIRREAEDFYSSKLGLSLNTGGIDSFKVVKRRLQDFYGAVNKAIFLDEIKNRVIEDLLLHRQEKHGGLASPTCRIEIEAEKFQFYIQQEITTFPTVAHQKFDTKSETERTKVFISYSHADKNYLNDIQRHFKPLLGQIDLWDDTKIQPGQKWKDEISVAISRTRVAILLLSTDFLGSEFIATNELPPLLDAAEKEGAVILTMILKPCLFDQFPSLNQYQAMNAPNKAVSSLNENEKEELFVNLVRQTKRILDRKT